MTIPAPRCAKHAHAHATCAKHAHARSPTLAQTHRCERVAELLSAALVLLLHRAITRCVLGYRSERAARQLLRQDAEAKAAMAKEAEERASEARRRKREQVSTGPMVRFCRFCDTAIESDEHMEPHLGGKRHKKCVAAAGSLAGDVDDCWVWREGVPARAEAAAAPRPPSPPPVFAAPSRKGKWKTATR